MLADLRWRTAIHEAAHAVVAVLIARPIVCVSIEPTDRSLGRIVLARSVVNLGNHRQVEREIALHLAGFISELIYDSGSIPTGCTDEVLYTFALAREIGLGIRGFERLVFRATKMLKAIWPTVLAVAGELLRHRCIHGRAVRRLVRDHLRLRERG